MPAIPPMLPTKITVKVPATCANLGPGLDCLAMALDMYNTVTFETSDEFEMSIEGEGRGELPTTKENLIYATFESFYRHIGQSAPCVKVLCHNRIPVERGLGSSAAAILSGLLAANELSGSRLPEGEILRLGAAREGHADNITAALAGGCVAVVNQGEGVSYLKVPLPPGLKAVTFVPDFRMKTSEGRKYLAEPFALQDVVFSTQRAALLVLALATNQLDMLKEATQDRLHQPRRRRFFPQMDSFFEAALGAGALGAFLSGGGSSIMALARDNELGIAKAMVDKGAEVGVKGKIVVLHPNLQGAHVIPAQDNGEGSHHCEAPKAKTASVKGLSAICNGLVGQPMFKLLAHVDAMERAGRKVLHFEIGDSDFEAHPHIVEATKKALDDHKTHYVNSTGILELRQAICDHTEDTLGFKPNANQVLVMPANGVIDFVVRCVANAGEEFICPDPGFSTYIAVANYTGVKRVGVPILEENAFRLEAGQVAMRTTDRTRLIIINSPSNPTGAMMTEEDMRDIAAVAKAHNVYLLSDEIYSKVTYGKTHFSPSVIDRCQERTIILNGFSKGYAMPGWRLGYAIGPEELIKKMGLLFETTFSCAPPFIQWAGIAALKGDQKVIDERMRQYKICRDTIVKGLNQIPGVSCSLPDGANYVFPNIKATGMTSTEFADFVLEKAGVALLPGSCFGEHGEGYVRLSYARRLQTIEEACAKMAKALKDR